MYGVVHNVINVKSANLDVLGLTNGRSRRDDSI